MSDITTDTTRFTSHEGFAGANINDLIRIAAQAIDYAGEISLCHSQTTTEIPVAYCVFGKHFRKEVTNNDHPTTMANVIKAIREDADCIYPQGAMSFEFQYDGMTFTIYVEDLYEEMVKDSIDMQVEEAEYEFNQISMDTSYIHNYITFNADMFRRDLQNDVESLISHYDGIVHEMYWNEFSSGELGDTITTRRQTLYMIRED